MTYQWLVDISRCLQPCNQTLPADFMAAISDAWELIQEEVGDVERVRNVHAWVTLSAKKEIPIGIIQMVVALTDFIIDEFKSRNLQYSFDHYQLYRCCRDFQRKAVDDQVSRVL